MNSYNYIDRYATSQFPHIESSLAMDLLNSTLQKAVHSAISFSQGSEEDLDSTFWSSSPSSTGVTLTSSFILSNLLEPLLKQAGSTLFLEPTLGRFQHATYPGPLLRSRSCLESNPRFQDPRKSSAFQALGPLGPCNGRRRWRPKDSSVPGWWLGHPSEKY